MDVHVQLGLLTGITSLIEIAIGVWFGLRVARDQWELARMRRAVAGLVAQESEKIQALLREL
jgi:hypothetical protein